MADKARGRSARPRPLRRARRAEGVVAVLTAADIPGKNDIAPVFADEPLLADERDPVPRPGAVRRRRATTRDAARRAARLAKIDIAEATPALTDRRRARDRRARCCPTTPTAAATSSAALAAAPHRLDGALRHRRPGAFLSRGAGLARHARRGGRDDRLLLDPGPDRGPAHRRARARPARRLRHRRDAAHGRRLRRQGEPGLRLGGARRARRARRPARPASCGSTATTISSSPASATISAPTGAVGYDDDGPRRRLRRHAQRALRLLGRSVARRRRPRDVPRRQLLLAARRPHRLDGG